VVFQGNGRCRIVHDQRDAERLWNGFAIATTSNSWECFAACLLGTHFHTFVRTVEPNLGAGMQKLLGGYARWFNLRHGLEGHLFRSPYWSTRVQKAEHLVVGVSYVVLNPVRAGLCAHPAEWRWTTHRELAGLEPQRLVKADGLFRMLGHDDLVRGREAYIRIIDNDLERLRAAPGYRHPALEYLAEVEQAPRKGG
jgi:hypothetical protein